MRDTVSTHVLVRLVYLARLREAFGSAGETIELADESPTVVSVVEMLRRRGEPWSSELAAGRTIRFAVNHRLASPRTVIASGDEIAILPPVTGG